MSNSVGPNLPSLGSSRGDIHYFDSGNLAGQAYMYRGGGVASDINNWIRMGLGAIPEVDGTDIADGRVQAFNASSGKLEYVDQPVGGGGGGGITLFARVYLATPQNVTHNVLTVVELDGASFDPDSLFDITTNYRYEPGETGYYEITAAIYISGFEVSDRMQTQIFVNGTIHTDNYSYANGVINSVHGMVTDMVKLTNTSDYIDIRVLHNASAPSFLFPGSEFTYATFKKIADL